MATHSYSCTLTKGGLIWVFLSGEIPATRDVTVALCLFTADFPTDSSGTRNHPPFSLLLWSNLKLCGFFRRRTILMAETNLPRTEATTLN